MENQEIDINLIQYTDDYVEYQSVSELISYLILQMVVSTNVIEITVTVKPVKTCFESPIYRL